MPIVFVLEAFQLSVRLEMAHPADDMADPVLRQVSTELRGLRARRVRLVREELTGVYKIARR